MSRTRVKICGLTRFQDAALAVALGADALGFVFWPRSPRAMLPEDVRQIVTALPPLVTRVGVFVDAAPDDVRAVVRAGRLDVVQLHGHERVADYGDVGARLVKASALETDQQVGDVAGWPADVMPLIDALDHDRKGGTGQLADWTRASALAARRPIVLAGGLTDTTVVAAVRRVRPWAVDVSSGVEAAPGQKDPMRMRAFFAALAAVGKEEM